MASRRLTLAFFAVGILFSIVREWSTPVVCVRGVQIKAATIHLVR